MPASNAPDVAALIKAHGDVQVMPTSFAQRRFWVLDQLDDGAAYTLPAGIRLQGALATDALERALNVVVARHEALRTVFALEGDEPVQVVLSALTIPLPIEDLRSLSPDAREAAVRARADANSNAPFKLATGPLLRASLLQLADEEHVLFLALHHIIADGWSIGILLDELTIAYTALSAGQDPALPVLPLQYADFAVWQRGAIQRAGAVKQLDYWTARLRDLSPIELPLDRPRPVVQTLNGSHRELAIDPEIAEGIRALARREGATAYMGFLAAFFALLHRYSGQNDIVVGSITSGRRRPEIEPLIGLFLNTVALRADVSGDAPFVDLLRTVRDSATGAYANQDVPFEHVVDAVQPARDRSRSPIFQVAFQLLEGLARDLRLPGLAASRVSGSKTSAKFDLTLMLHAAPNGGLRAVLEFNTDLFDGATIERMLAHYVTLLGGVARDASAPVGRLPLMTSSEYALVTEEWNAAPAPLPSWTMPQRVLERAAAQPDAIAVHAGGDTLTYGELARQSASLARQLAAIGVAPGDRVAVCMDRTPGLVVALLAVLRAGAAYVPLDAAHPADRLSHVLDDASVRAILTDATSSARLPATVAPVLIANDFIAGAGDESGSPILAAEAPAYVIYTSGSTGKPKGVVVSHGALANFLASMAERPGLASSDVLVAVTTVAFDIAGLELWLPLISGARVELASREVTSDGPALLSLLNAAVASVPAARVLMQATPATWLLLLEAGWRGAPNVVILCGGEAWPPKLAESLLPRCQALWNVYGPTETTIWSTRHQVTSPADVYLGEPLANTTLLVLEPSGEPAPLGVPGELWIGGAGLATGYHGKPELTAERFVAHPRYGRLYRTGDRVRRAGNGELEYFGRLDQQVKLRGYRIELGEIESVLAAQPGVAQAVAAIVHDSADARLVAYVVLHPDTAEESARLTQLVEALRRALPEYMVPSTIVRLETLPLTPNGKVDRRALPSPSALDQLAAPYVAPRSSAEVRIASVWGAVLGRDRVGIHDDFFALGGHSLLAMRVIARLADEFPVRLTIGTLFDARTVAALAERVSQHLERGELAADRIEPRTDRGPAPLSHAQELLWLYEQMTPGTAAYNIPMARRIRGPFDFDAFRRAFDIVVARHESLRTVFVETAGVPAQVIMEGAAVEFETHDLRSTAAAFRESEATDLLQEASARPFDMTVGTRPRVVLVTMGADDTLLLIVVHHIVFDGASAGILFSELAAAYSAVRNGGDPAFASLPIQLADLATWERRTLTGARLDPAMSFWREALDGAPPGVALPTDFSRPLGTIGPGARHEALLSSATRDAVRALAKAHDVTPFTVLLAGFQVLLHRYSGQADLVVGTAVAGRERSGTGGLLGYLANTLAVRAQFDDDPTFSQFLGQVRDRVLRALDHQDVPYEMLVRELRAGRPPAEQALFRILFTLQDADAVTPRLGDATLERVAIDLGAAKADLTASAAEVANGIELALEYRSDLFRAATIARLVENFSVLLVGAATSPSTAVSRLPILGETDQRLIAELDATSGVTWPIDATLHGLFSAQVRRCPDAVAVEFNNERLTYAELERRANRLAWALRDRGVGPADLVAVCMEKTADVIVALLAILKAGAAYVPIDPGYPDDRVAFMLEDCGARLVVTDEASKPRLASFGVASLVASTGWTDASAERNDPPPDVTRSGDPCYVIYTSGSTGKPKGVLIEHGNVVRLFFNSRFQFAFGSEDTWTAFHSFSFDFSVWEMYGALLYGGRLIMIPREVAQQPAEFLSLLEEKQVTVLNQVPSAFSALMNADLGRAPARLALRYVIFGGEALQPGLLREWRARHPGVALINMFGITETTVHVTYKEIGAAEIESGTSNIGRPIPTLSVRLLDTNLQPVPVGAHGEICVSGAGVARGYLNRPELSAEKFVADPFVLGGRMYRSGDLGRVNAAGEIEYLGRRDSQVKVRGFRVELGEIETVLAQHPAVSACVASVRSTPGAGASIVAYYVSQAGAINRGELREWLVPRLPEFMVPSFFVQLEALPLTSNGKVDRSALPDPATVRTEVPVVEPRDDIESVVANLWRDVLDVERLDVETSFFELGGHSLLAIRVVSQIAKVFRTRITLRQFFDEPTIAGVARRLVATESKPGEVATIATLMKRLQAMSPAEREAVRLRSGPPSQVAPR